MDKEQTVETEVKEFPSTEKTQLTIEDRVYRLAEMSSAMKNSVDNIEKVSNEQNTLIEIILSSDKSAMFRDFVKESEQQLDDMNKQKTILLVRAGLLEEVVELCKDENINKAINMLLEALNVFGN